jgi:uncharacterized protein
MRQKTTSSFNGAGVTRRTYPSAPRHADGRHPLLGHPPTAVTIWHTADMAWLVCDAKVLASAEVAATRKERRQGLLGRHSIEGALVIDPCRWIHTIGMKFPIDVAYLDPAGIVVKTIQMQRFRMGIPVWNARSVIEAEAGAFGRWGLRVGDQIEIRTDDSDHT